MFQKGNAYYTNGKVEIFCKECPEGFHKGRLPSICEKIKKSKEEKPNLGCSEAKLNHLQKMTSERHSKKMVNLISRISKKDLIKYYLEENHSYYETIQHYNITEYSFIQLCKEYKTFKKGNK